MEIFSFYNGVDGDYEPKECIGRETYGDVWLYGMGLDTQLFIRVLWSGQVISPSCTLLSYLLKSAKHHCHKDVRSLPPPQLLGATS